MYCNSNNIVRLIVLITTDCFITIITLFIHVRYPHSITRPTCIKVQGLAYMSQQTTPQLGYLVSLTGLQ